MIIKNQSIDFHTVALQYCERGGELLYTKKCIGTALQIANQMKEQNSLNTQCKKQYVHIKMRFSPEDFGILVEQEILDIANKYLTLMELQDNAYAIYIHKAGTIEEHYHIVASRIKPNNRAASDEYTHYRNNDFCRKIEEKFSLRKVDRYLEKVKSGVSLESTDLRIDGFKEIIDNAIKVSKNIDQLQDLLKTEGITMKVGRGVVFIDEDKVVFKGSQIGRKYSLNGIKKQLQSNEVSKPSNNSKVSYQNIPLKGIEQTVHLSNSSSTSLSENNGSMNSDIDDIVNSGKKKKRNM